jgi:2-methylisocitrate lyase-like PEP mutase family enzyme
VLSLRELHRRGGGLVVPNAWDAASARAFAQAGFETLATSSAAIAWTRGRADGQQVGATELIDVAGAIARSVAIPVSVDAEAGYGDVPATVNGLLDVGVAGVNLEDGAFDGGTDPLVAADLHADAIAEVRAVAAERRADLWINARTDAFLRVGEPPHDRLAVAIERLCTYRDAGADAVFAPGATSAQDIAALAAAVEIPLNVMLMPGMPGLAELRELGVARVTLGASPLLACLTHLEEVAQRLRGGDLDALARELPSRELLVALLAGRATP